jgi:hypothetical protein
MTDESGTKTRAIRIASALAVISFALVALAVSVAAVFAATDPVGNYDILIYANQDYQLNLQFKADGVPENITGRTYKLQAKKTGAAASFLTFSSSITNAANGQTRYWLTRATTRANANSAGTYDLMETGTDGKVTYRLKGGFRIVETVTR